MTSYAHLEMLANYTISERLAEAARERLAAQIPPAQPTTGPRVWPRLFAAILRLSTRALWRRALCQTSEAH